MRAFLLTASVVLPVCLARGIARDEHDPKLLASLPRLDDQAIFERLEKLVQDPEFGRLFEYEACLSEFVRRVPAIFDRCDRG